MQKRITTSMMCCVAVFFLTTTAQAQNASRYSIGINFGTFIYNGDLTPWKTGSWKTPAFAWGLSGHRTLSSTLAARLELNFGKLRGDETEYGPEYRQYRAFAFNSTVTEIILAAEWNPLGNDKKLSPYLFGGIGYANMKITRDYSRFNEAYFAGEPFLKQTLSQDVATPLPGGVAIFPVGLGLKFALSEKISLHGEAAHRFTTSDYIDGFSYAANPDSKDGYTKYSIGLRLHFGNKDRYACPPTIY